MRCPYHRTSLTRSSSTWRQSNGYPALMPPQEGSPRPQSKLQKLWPSWSSGLLSRPQILSRTSPGYVKTLARACCACLQFTLTNLLLALLQCKWGAYGDLLKAIL
jgi:hypothetical protein